MKIFKYANAQILNVSLLSASFPYFDSVVLILTFSAPGLQREVCYKIVSGAKSWKEAQNYCFDRLSHLVGLGRT